MDQVITKNIEDYRTESWKLEHVRAMACTELEDWLDYGLSLLAGLRKIESRHRERVQRGQIPLDRVAIEEMGRLLESWYAPASHLLDLIAEFERQGYHVANAGEFHTACMSSPIDGLEPEQIAKSAQQFASGKGISLRKVSDELRGRAV